MNEVEVKIKVTDLDQCVKIFEKQGCILGEPKIQHDVVYFPKDLAENNTHPLGRNFLRIRRVNDRILFTLKQPQTNQLDCLEHELEILDADEMENIIKQLDYVPYVEVKKSRREGTLGEYAICVDDVENLGGFIELEKITDETADVVQGHMMELLESIGIDGEPVHDGYDVLMKRTLGN